MTVLFDLFTICNYKTRMDFFMLNHGAFGNALLVRLGKESDTLSKSYNRLETSQFNC